MTDEPTRRPGASADGRPVTSSENEALLDAMASLVHELRTPVVGVMGGCDLLDGTALDAPQRRYLSMVRASATTLLARVNNLLDLRRADHASAPLQEGLLYLYDILESVFDVLAEPALSAGCMLTYEIAADVPTYLVGDEGRLHQVLLNLVGNAVRYASDAPIRVRVEAEVEDERAQVTLHVDDGGAGIADDERELLFVPFWQRPAQHMKDSSGLGLAVVALVVEQLGGTLEVGTSPEGGARFTVSASFGIQSRPQRRTVRLPQVLVDRGVRVVVGDPALNAQLVDMASGLGARVVADDDDDTPGVVITDDEVQHAVAGVDGIPAILVRRPGENLGPLGDSWLLVAPVRRVDLAESLRAAVTGVAPDPAASTLQTLSGRRVLLVDDAEDNRELIAGLLKRWGYVVVDVASGREAVGEFEKGAFAGVLLDIQLDGESGEVVLGELRRLEASRTRITPIAAMTAAVRPADIDRLLRAGFDAHIPKPVTRQELKRALRALFESAPRPATAAQPSGAPSPPSAPAGSASAPLPADLGELRMLLLGGDWDGLEDALAALEAGRWRDQLGGVRAAVTERDREATQRALQEMAVDGAPLAAASAAPVPVLWNDEADAEILDELRPAFIEARAVDRERMLALLEEGEAGHDGLMRIGHRIMGTAALYGYPALGDAARTLHAVAAAGDRDNLTAAVDRAVQLIEEIMRSSDAARAARR